MSVTIAAIGAWVAANPGTAVFIGGAAAQAGSWVVKKSPWLWDDHLLGWATKNTPGIKHVASAVAKTPFYKRWRNKLFGA